MTTERFNLTIHMVSSIDGYIAKRDNSISWFDTNDYYGEGLSTTEEERQEFLRQIDCYIMGSKTYELAMELSGSYGWPYGDTPTIVVTTRNLKIERPNIKTYSGDLTKLVDEYLKPNYRNVWLVGGAQLAKEFIRLNLVDKIRQGILPIILGEGLAFFDQIGREITLHLTEVRAYKNGMVEIGYEISGRNLSGSL